MAISTCRPRKRTRFFLFLFSTLALQILLLSAAAAAAAASTSNYQSVQALNEYGHAVQLQHAAQAAKGLTTTALIVVQRPNCHWIVSIDDSSTSKQHDYLKKSNPLAHFLYTPPSTRSTWTTEGKEAKQNEKMMGFEEDDDDFEHYQAIVYSGVQPDGDWLVAQLRQGCKAHWDRYNDGSPSHAMILDWMTELMQSFWQFDKKDYYYARDFACQAMDSSAWARPLGVRVALLCHSSGSGNVGTKKSKRQQRASSSLHVMEPSGMVTQHLRLVCMGGPHSERLEEALARGLLGQDESKTSNNDDDDYWNNPANDSELRRKLIRIVAETLDLNHDAAVRIQTVGEASKARIQQEEQQQPRPMQ